MDSKELWIFIFLIGIVLFNWPFLNIHSGGLTTYLFGVWILFIVAIGAFITILRRQKTDNDR